jgi:hypothetical protein
VVLTALSGTRTPGSEVLIPNGKREVPVGDGCLW